MSGDVEAATDAIVATIPISRFRRLVVRLVAATGARLNGAEIVLEDRPQGAGWTHRFTLAIPIGCFSEVVTAIVAAEDAAIARGWITPPPDNSSDGEPGW
jgi:hypothetical protein